MKSRFARLLALGALAPLTACVPNLGDKPVPRSAASLPATQSLPNQGGQWPGDGWWKAYGDAQLDQLIAEGLAGSPDIASAAARLARAQGLAESAGAALGPSVGAEGTIGKTKQSYNFGIPPAFVPRGWQDYGVANLKFSFDLDLWGKNRATLRAAMSDREAARVEMAEARLTLASAIAASYADLARLYAERDVAEEALRIRQDTAGLVGNRVKSGLDNEGQRHQAEAAVPAARDDLSQIDEQVALTRNQLAALIGAGPDRGLTIARPKIGGLGTLALPPSAGIDLVGRRPDIVAARARVESAAQRIKAAHAAFYPDISLSGLVGLEALGFDNILKSGSTYGNVGPALSLPIFDNGKRAGDYRVARADYDAAVANYDKTLIDALHDVANAVASRNALGSQSSDARISLADSEKAYEVARLRYKAGLSNYLDVLTAEQALIVARRRDADLSARAFTLDVALVRALGGGYAVATDKAVGGDTGA